jgi:hypothetical protein
LFGKYRFWRGFEIIIQEGEVFEIMKNQGNFKIGDSVRVKQGEEASEFDCKIGGWQGRIFDICKNDKGEELIEIMWDSITLKNLPESFIEKCEDNEWDWGRMNLDSSTLEHAEPRDTEDDVWDTRDKVGFFDTMEMLGEEGLQMMNALNELGLDEDIKELRGWWNKCRKDMIFPFEAKVISLLEDDEEKGDLKQDDIVEVLRLNDLDDFLGVLVGVNFKKDRYTLALSEIEATDRNSPNYTLMVDYRKWFDER